MNSEQAKKLSLPDIMSRLGYEPTEITKGGAEYWYCSPFRKEKEPSFHTSYLGGKWIKVTPTFNLSLCEKFGVHPLEFDGRNDSLMHPYNARDERHMEYVKERGTFDDFPFEALVADARGLVRDLEVKGNDLVIATHGRGFWILDDITPLRQLDPAITAAEHQAIVDAIAARDPERAATAIAAHFDGIRRRLEQG